MKSSIPLTRRASTTPAITTSTVWVVAFTAALVLSYFWFPADSTALQSIERWIWGMVAATVVVAVLGAAGAISFGERYYPKALRSSPAARFVVLTVGMIVMVGIVVDLTFWQMNANERFLASKLTNRLETTVASVNCTSAPQNVRTCSVKFSGDLDIIPDQDVEFTVSPSNHPEASFRWSHDIEVGKSSPVERSVRLKTSIDTSKVDSQEAAAWIIETETAAINAAHQRAVAWLESEEKSRNAANSYH